MRPQSILLLKDKLNLNHVMRSRTGLWPGRLFKLKIQRSSMMFALEGKHKKWKNVDKECYIVICLSIGYTIA